MTGGWTQKGWDRRSKASATSHATTRGITPLLRHCPARHFVCAKAIGSWQLWRHWRQSKMSKPGDRTRSVAPWVHFVTCFRRSDEVYTTVLWLNKRETKIPTLPWDKDTHCTLLVTVKRRCVLACSGSGKHAVLVFKKQMLLPVLTHSSVKQTFFEMAAGTDKQTDTTLDVCCINTSWYVLREHYMCLVRNWCCTMHPTD
jgi:hypothetical protein